jgi:hypothetical protein
LINLAVVFLSVFSEHKNIIFSTEFPDSSSMFGESEFKVSISSLVEGRFDNP